MSSLKLLKRSQIVKINSTLASPIDLKHCCNFSCCSRSFINLVQPISTGRLPCLSLIRLLPYNPPMRPRPYLPTTLMTSTNSMSAETTFSASGTSTLDKSQGKNKKVNFISNLREPQTSTKLLSLKPDVSINVPVAADIFVKTRQLSGELFTAATGPSRNTHDNPRLNSDQGSATDKYILNPVRDILQEAIFSESTSLKLKISRTYRQNAYKLALRDLKVRQLVVKCSSSVKTRRQKVSSRYMRPVVLLHKKAVFSM